MTSPARAAGVAAAAFALAAEVSFAGAAAGDPLVSEEALAEARRAAVCAVGDRFGRLDLVPVPGGDLALRVVTTDDPDATAEALRAAWSEAAGAGGIARIDVAPPRPLLAVVIDDLGLHPGQVTPLWDLGEPVTWALFPDAPWSQDYAKWLAARGASILVHVPMEPDDPAHMSMPGYLTGSQPAHVRRALLREALFSIPDAAGFSNHQGSRMTRDREAMDDLLRSVGAETIVLDSRTSRESALAAAARDLGLASAERTVFLDHVRDVDEIRAQLEAAVSVAERTGTAVAIGHPYPETALALRAFLAEGRDRVQWVGLERVLDRPRAPRWIERCEPPR